LAAWLNGAVKAGGFGAVIRLAQVKFGAVSILLEIHGVTPASAPLPGVWWQETVEDEKLDSA
jgi:hypothetical protein